jgi:hypothetical protein
MAGQGLARAAVAAGRAIGPAVSKLGKRAAQESGKYSKAGKEAGSNVVSNTGAYVDDPSRPFQTGNKIIDNIGNFIFGDNSPTDDDFKPGGKYNPFPPDHPAPGSGDEGNPPGGEGKDGKGSKASIAAAKELQNQQNLPKGRQDFPDIPASSWPMFG